MGKGKFTSQINFHNELFYLPLALVSSDISMILNFGNKETQKIWNGERVKTIPLEIQQVGRRKLRMLHNSETLADLGIPPSNRLEKLSGNLKEYYSIRINNQWRIVFKWINGIATDVQIVDYH